jgi:hypothetical protein
MAWWVLKPMRAKFMDRNAVAVPASDSAEHIASVARMAN